MTSTLDPASGLPTLFGFDRGLYRARPQNFLLSLLVHAVGLAAVLMTAAYLGHTHTALGPGIPLLNGPLTFVPDEGSGGGSGGTEDKLPASHGAVPAMRMDEQFTPPEVVPTNLDPKLPMPASVMAMSAVRLPVLGPVGDPNSQQSIPSNGPGTGTGIGSKCCRGDGNTPGRAIGNGVGNVFIPGRGGVTRPRPIYDPDPDYSDEARAAKYQGAVLLWVVVGADGRTRDIRIQQSAGMGLDEKAMAAVSKWRFEPATLDGKPVAAQINVQVNFRLY